MKKVIAVIMCMVMLVGFSACKSEPIQGEDITVSAEKAEELFEDMTAAIEKGNYDKAVEYYNSGAADADNDDVRDWYYYSLAMQEYEAHGCVGYPLNLLQYFANSSFEPAKKAIEEMQKICDEIEGVYECDGRYIYVLDGKIVTSVGERLTGMVFTSYEVVCKKDLFCFAERSQDGTHTILYTLELSENKLNVEATEDNANDLFSGEYTPVSVEYPEIVY